MLGGKSTPFSYTSSNYQTFLGKSPCVFNDSEKWRSFSYTYRKYDSEKSSWRVLALMYARGTNSTDLIDFWKCDSFSYMCRNSGRLENAIVDLLMGHGWRVLMLVAKNVLRLS